MEQPQSNPYLIPGAIVIAGLIIAGAIYFAFFTKAPERTAGQTNDKTVDVRPIDKNDFILGNPDAPVVVLEYSDFECPFCKQFHESMNRIMKEYGEGGKVAWVFRQFPLEQLHSKAPTEALASECAAAQGGNSAFWAYADKLFTGPGNNQLDLAKLPQFASDIGLDRAKFEACLKDTSENGLMKNVTEDFNDAVQSGGQGTPYTHIVMNGEVHSLGGALPYPALKAAVDLFIKNAEAGGKILPPSTE